MEKPHLPTGSDGNESQKSKFQLIADPTEPNGVRVVGGAATLFSREEWDQIARDAADEIKAAGYEDAHRIELSPEELEWFGL